MTNLNQSFLWRKVDVIAALKIPFLKTFSLKLTQEIHKIHLKHMHENASIFRMTKFVGVSYSVLMGQSHLGEMTIPIHNERVGHQLKINYCWT